MRIIKRILLISLLALSFQAFALDPSPWFTGPLLAPAGSTYPAGHIGYQAYVFYTDTFGRYNHRWKRESAPSVRTVNPVMIITLGLTSRSDLQLTVPYNFNSLGNVSYNGFGDVSATLGYQALTDDPHTWRPDLRLTIAEAFPTGRFEMLNPQFNGTDALGAGSFQTSLAATFQKLWHFTGEHFLRGRWNFTYTIPARVHVNGLNAFGGAANTDGTLNLGNHFSSDLAFEYTLTRHWAPAVDLLFTASGKNTFSGNRGTTGLALPAPISTSSNEEWSIAPAMEYNFNSVVGIIVGAWFTVGGRNSTDFVSGVFSIEVSL